MVKALGGKYWDPQDIEINAGQVREAHSLGLKVVPWTNPVTSGKDVDLNIMKKLVAMGVDGIITDRPDLVGKLKN
jgi:glycerophosphoryl diester phosphodiesterase